MTHLPQQPIIPLLAGRQQCADHAESRHEQWLSQAETEPFMVNLELDVIKLALLGITRSTLQGPVTYLDIPMCLLYGFRNPL
jgi:hypothetical protein